MKGAHTKFTLALCGEWMDYCWPESAVLSELGICHCLLNETKENQRFFRFSDTLHKTRVHKTLCGNEKKFWKYILSKKVKKTVNSNLKNRLLLFFCFLLLLLLLFFIFLFFANWFNAFIVLLSKNSISTLKLCWKWKKMLT